MWQRTGDAGINGLNCMRARGGHKTRSHQDRHLAVGGGPRGFGAIQSLQVGGGLGACGGGAEDDGQAPPAEAVPLGRDNYDHVVKRFDQEFAGRKRLVFSRHQFWSHQRSEGQSFDEYSTELCTLAQACEFLAYV